MTNPISVYADPDRFEKERSQIFARSWQFVGLENDLVRKGDFLRDDVAGVSVVVLKDSGGVLRAFRNLCPHRAGPLVTDDRGRCEKGLVCGLHGWRFELDGRLVAAPGYEAATGFDPAAFSLFPVQVDVWRGLVFVNLDAGSGSLADHMAAVHDHSLTPAERPARLQHAHKAKCNWKLYAEGYLWGDPATGKFDLHDETIHYVGPGRDQKSHRHWVFVWPNLAFSFYRGVLLIEVLRPVDAQTTEIEHLFLHQPEDPTVEAAILASEDATDDLAEACERMQVNRSTLDFQVSPVIEAAEAGIGWFHRKLDAALGL